ncbi:MAG: transcription elongation factor GreA [Patescibacteria group bacterium]|nr:transcription elongation factor GreA [Patescibacteria group bacterium]
MANFLTQEGLEKLKKELDFLKSVKAREIAQRLNTAAGFGDLSENAAYHQAKEDLAFLRGRTRELEKAVVTAKIIEKKGQGAVCLGSKVVVGRNKEKQTIEIVGEQEADPANSKISYQSPLGKALLGKTKGNKVEIETPKGKTVYQVLQIS